MLPDASTPGTDLPVREALPALLAEVAEPGRPGGAAVLEAPPGTGKTTLVPLALAGALQGRVVVAEPRRVAARAAARRMAALLGEQVGERVGYTVRGERRVGPGTRIEVVTTGVLVRRLQRDPELPGTSAVLLDECHERHLDTDLALAFTVDVRAALRPDLALVAASATAEAERLAVALGAPGRPAALVGATATLHPVEVVWSPPPTPIRPAYGLRVDPALLAHVATTVRRAVAEGAGDVLVILPGAGEISDVASRLSGLPGTDVVPLHGRLPASVQDAALRPGPRRRVVLATAVAESSLTVPGVRAVVDAGLARVPRTDHARGLGALVTVAASRAAAQQRAGRAGREGPGRAYRCWSEAEHPHRPAQPDPEVATADLTSFVLELACWGHPDGTGLALLDPPPAAAAEAARSTLRALGAVDAAGRVTVRGRVMAGLGTHPRLARALLDGAPRVGARRAVEVVALLGADAPRRGDDLLALWRVTGSGADPGARARWREECRRLSALLAEASTTRDPQPPLGRLPDDLAAGLVVGLAHPGRLARARTPGSDSYLMTGGTEVVLDRGSGLAGSTWLAVAEADRQPGRSSARVRLAVAVDEATAREAAAGLEVAGPEVGWRGGDVVARQVERLGAVVLAERPLRDPGHEALAAALQEGLDREGLGLLDWNRAATGLRGRLAFLHRAIGPPWPAVDDAALLADLPRWLGPELARARRRADLARVDVATALRRLLPWPQAGRLDELAPERLGVPSGSQVRVDYTDPAAPVLAVRLQEAFGWTSTPRLAAGRVPVVLHLLSPASRPVAVTGDLESFWARGYPQVRAELRGRYPRHAWPEDPLTAPPTRRVRPRR